MTQDPGYGTGVICGSPVGSVGSLKGVLSLFIGGLTLPCYVLRSQYDNRHGEWLATRSANEIASIKHFSW